MQNSLNPFGRIEVICGPMFSGKTEELLRRIKRAKIARLKVQLFKPTIDKRYHQTQIVSHSQMVQDAVALDKASDIYPHLFDSTRVVGIDEVQFFDDQLIKVVNRLARRGYRVICAGLDQDSRGKPFGPMPALLACADAVEKIQAICTICGNLATKTHRKFDEGDQVQIGEQDLYEARCREHWDGDWDQQMEFSGVPTSTVPSSSLEIRENATSHRKDPRQGELNFL